MSTFGERLKGLMNQHQLNDRTLSELVECGHASVSNWARDVYLPKPEMIRKLAEVFDVSEKYLLVGEEPKEEKDTAYEITGRLYVPKDEDPEHEEINSAPTEPVIDMRLPSFEAGIKYNKETKDQLEDIDICIKCLKYMNMSRERKIRVHKLLSGIRTDLECKVLFGEM